MQGFSGKRRRRQAVLAGVILLFSAVGAFRAHAEVLEFSELGFVIRHVAQVPVGSDEAFAALVEPSLWWSPDHTYSGEARNLSIDARPGGCFCEVIPGERKDVLRGGVVHMRVIYVDKPKALRMTGALGPLQAEAISGTLTWTITPMERGNGSQVVMEYVVGGYMRSEPAKIGPLVDKVLGEQFQAYAKRIGGDLKHEVHPAFD